MADAITDAMIEAGVAAWDFTLTTGELVERIYLAMEAARQPQLPSDDGLIKALEPFAELGRSEVAEQFTDGTIWLLVNGERRFGAISMGDLRKAAEALSRHKAPLSVAGDDVRYVQACKAELDDPDWQPNRADKVEKRPDGFVGMHFDECDYFLSRGRNACNKDCCS